MAQTTFSGPVTSNAGFNSDDTLTAADLSSGGFNLTNFTVRPAATYANTVAALVGAVNQRTAGVSGGNIFGVYAQTSFSDNPTSTLTGLIQPFTVWLIADQAQALVQHMAQLLILHNLQEQGHQPKSVHCFW
jgi:hypothetical protein